MDKKEICQNDVCMVGGEQRIKISQNTKNVIHLSAVCLLLLISWLFGKMSILPLRLVDTLSLLTVFFGVPNLYKSCEVTYKR